MTQDEAKKYITEYVESRDALMKEKVTKIEKWIDKHEESHEKDHALMKNLNDKVISISTNLDNLITRLAEKKADWKWLAAIGIAVLVPIAWDIIGAGGKP